MTTTRAFTDEQIEQIIKEQIQKEFMYDKNIGELTTDYPLIAEGIIESMGIMRMISFLEDTFSIVVEPEEFLLENFETVQTIKLFTIAKLDNSEDLKYSIGG